MPLLFSSAKAKCLCRREGMHSTRCLNHAFREKCFPRRTRRRGKRIVLVFACGQKRCVAAEKMSELQNYHMDMDMQLEMSVVWAARADLRPGTADSTWLATRMAASIPMTMRIMRSAAIPFLHPPAGVSAVGKQEKLCYTELLSHGGVPWKKESISRPGAS